MVDAVRLPAYLYHTGGGLVKYWQLVGLAIAGVPDGTRYGERVLGRLPEDRFRRVVWGFLVVPGLSLVVTG